MQPILAKQRIFNFFLASSLTLGGTFLTFGLVWLFAPSDSYIYRLFFERSWIQYASTFCFWLIIATLVLKQLSFRKEQIAFKKAQGILTDKQLSSTLIWSDAHSVRQKFTGKESQPYQHSLTFSRIVNALDRLFKTQSTKAVEDYFRTRSDIDSGELESSYAGIRYFTWLIPTLGFIGTVMGIGIGIAGFADIIQRAQDFREIQKFLPIVTNSLGTAFDTTLLALGLSAVAVFYMSFLLKREEQLLEQIDHLCLDAVCPLFREHSSASDEIIRAFHDDVEQIRSSMNGNRAAIENVIRQEFPALLSDELAPRFKDLAIHLQAIAEAARVLISAQSQAGSLSNQLAIEAMQGLAEALAEVKALKGMKAALLRNNELFERLQEDLQRFSEAAQMTGTQAEKLAAIVQQVRQVVEQMPPMTQLLQSTRQGIEEVRQLVENKAPQLEHTLQKNSETIDEAAKILARSNEGNADVLSALTKLINRIDERDHPKAKEA